MEQSPSWFSASQEIPRILWNPILQYRSHQILRRLYLSLVRSIQFTFHLAVILEYSVWIRKTN